jgi:hypothetical protein
LNIGRTGVLFVQLKAVHHVGFFLDCHKGGRG